MTYNWDPEKNRRNIARHGIEFADAVRIFESPTVENADDRFDYGEILVYAIGLVEGIEITVIYTDVSASIRRIISAWRAEEMREKHTGKVSDMNSTDWERLRSRTDQQIRRAIEDDSDVQPTDAAFWKDAHVVIPQPKQTITIRLDADLLAWLRRQKGYQTRINAVLRSYMNANLAPKNAPSPGSARPTAGRRRQSTGTARPPR
jgi:hypothetical protein